MQDANMYFLLNNLERIVYNWLIKHSILFTAQAPMFGGAGELGSAIVDFILTERNIVLRCMGTFWHSGLETNARDLLGREKLTEAGYTVVDVWEENLAPDRVNNTLELAIQGLEVIR